VLDHLDPAAGYKEEPCRPVSLKEEVVVSFVRTPHHTPDQRRALGGGQGRKQGALAEQICF
jgi:hypothetical protein